MQTEFDRWNRIKKNTNAIDELERLYYREGEIWWVRLGKNIGYEIDGKSREFTRPVIVLKKYNQYSFLVAPLTTAQKPNPYRLPIGIVDGSERLVKKIAVVSEDALDVIKEEASRVSFG